MQYISLQTGETVLHYSARSGNEEVLAAIVKKIGPGAVQIALNRQDKVRTLFGNVDDNTGHIFIFFEERVVAVNGSLR